MFCFKECWPLINKIFYIETFNQTHKSSKTERLDRNHQCCVTESFVTHYSRFYELICHKTTLSPESQFFWTSKPSFHHYCISISISTSSWEKYLLVAEHVPPTSPAGRSLYLWSCLVLDEWYTVCFIRMLSENKSSWEHCGTKQDGK